MSPDEIREQAEALLHETWSLYPESPDDPFPSPARWKAYLRAVRALCVAIHEQEGPQ